MNRILTKAKSHQQPHNLGDDLAAVLLLGHDPASHLVEVLGVHLVNACDEIKGNEEGDSEVVYVGRVH